MFVTSSRSMFTTSVRGMARVHQPLIKFVGKRQWPSTTEPPHPHPFAPKEYAKAFSQEASGASSTPKSSKGGAVAEFWEAPERFWRPRIRELQDWEIEAITSGGASLRK
ncbi:uncharacterized protein SCHCODRAFT_02594922 [Schizophyllum commune H4-8]|nr:uncharacterized protein SCHCODRAFT_02594922 [Schizophyllum commune H4-8]KAI5884932.1 hypothetical protein SCHCODRAFT_02594922 [Schizophyllum commune H4-8]